MSVHRGGAYGRLEPIASRRSRWDDDQYDESSASGTHADQYMRVTVYLATALFLAAISGRFPIRGVRIGLVAVGIVVPVLALGTLATLPRPPA